MPATMLTENSYKVKSILPPSGDIPRSPIITLLLTKTSLSALQTVSIVRNTLPMEQHRAQLTVLGSQEPLL